MVKQKQPSDEGQPRGWGGQSWGAGPGPAMTVAREKGEGRHTAACTFQKERPGDHKSILFLKKKTEQIYTKYFHLFWANRAATIALLLPELSPAIWSPLLADPVSPCLGSTCHHCMWLPSQLGIWTVPKCSGQPLPEDCTRQGAARGASCSPVSSLPAS